MASWTIHPDALVVRDREGARWYRCAWAPHHWSQFLDRRDIPAVPQDKLRGFGPFTVLIWDTKSAPA